MTRMFCSRLALALFVAFSFGLGPVNAAEPIFPLGSRVGLVPPPGLVRSKTFVGFADAANKVAMLVVALPQKAYADIVKSMTAEALKKQGITLESRAPFALGVGKAFLIVGRQQLGAIKLHKWLLVAAAKDLTAFVTVQVPDDARTTYPDATIRAALASLAVRSRVPDMERLELLPFKLTDLAGFKIGTLIPGRAVLLTDAPPEKKLSLDHPRIIIAAVPANPAQMDDHVTLARHVFSTLAGVDEVRVTEAGSLRIGGQQGHQILATGKDAATGTELTIVQWLRFGSGGFLQMLATSPTRDWVKAYTRFRAVRDSINPR
jgi:hypothetical protein